MSIQYEINIDRNNEKQRYAAVYFARTLSSVQSAIILLLKGLASQSECLLRMSLESLFGLGAIAKNSEAIEKLNQSNEYEKSKFAKKLKLWVSTGKYNIKPDVLKGFEIDKHLKSKIVKVSIFDIAKLGGYESWYKEGLHNSRF